MRRVHVADSPAEAHLIQGLLESHGIQAVVEGDYLHGALGAYGTNLARQPSVSVPDADAQRAVDIIRNRQPAGAPDEALERED